MRRWILVLGVLALLAMTALAGCARENSAESTEPTKVEPVQGTSYNKITLTDDAFANLGIRTEAVRAETATATTPGAALPKMQLVIPLAALVFNPEANPFVYTSPTSRTFVRAAVAIAGYRGDEVLLKSGPPSGTLVVTVGNPALLGIEYGVGQE